MPQREQMPKKVGGGPGPGRPAERAESDPKRLLWVQQTAGNTAAAALVQRWKDGVVPKGDVPPDVKQWVKGVMPDAKTPSSWAKGVPPGDKATGLGDKGVGQGDKGGVATKEAKWVKGEATKAGGRSDVRSGEHRDPAAAVVKEIEGLAAQGAAAARAIAAATDAVVGRLATTTAEGAAHAKALDQEATGRLGVAKSFWTHEEPFGGVNAAKQAEGIDSLWTKADALAATTKATQGHAKWMGPFADRALGIADKAVTAVDKAGKGFGKGGTVGTDVHRASLAARAELRNARYDVKKHQAQIKAHLADVQKSVDAAAESVTKLTTTKTEAWAPLKVGGGPQVIIGRLQQQLNATRAKGADRLSITAHFSAPTEALLKQFQGAKATGVADSSTWAKLDTAAPAVRQAGQWVVMSQEGAKVQQGSFKGRAGLEGMTRPWILPKVTANEAWYAVDKGPAVVELQQRLANWVASLSFWQRLTTPSPRQSGVYDTATGRSLKAFQKAKGLPVDGRVGGPVWDALESVGGKVTEGMVMHDELTEVEGQERGQTIKYSWKAAPGELKITVRLNFVHTDPMAQDLVEAGLKKDPADNTKLHPDEVPRLKARMQTAVGLWQGDITRVWNGFSAKDMTPGSKAASAKITFVPEVVNGGGDATVNVIPGPTADNATGRSDAANWFATDTTPNLAPHEFGHLIGLPDEYSRREEHFVRTTGTEPQIGEVQAPHKGFKASDYAIDIANKIAAAAPVAHAGDPATPARKAMIEAARGKATAFADRVAALGLHESAFGRAVSEAFATNPTAAAVSGGKNFPEYIVGLVSGFNQNDGTELRAMWQVQGVYEAGLRPFLVSNESVMGGGDATPARGKQMPVGHDHPVQPRHLQPYLKHLDWAWGGTWKVV